MTAYDLDKIGPLEEENARLRRRVGELESVVRSVQDAAAKSYAEETLGERVTELLPSIAAVLEQRAGEGDARA